MTEMPDQAATTECRRVAVSGVLAAALLALPPGGGARAQSLTVLPVVVQMAAGQKAAAVTVVNSGDREAAIQIRVFAWTQPDGSDDRLATCDEVQSSPPLATIPAGNTQIVRLMLRRPPREQEGTYRIVLDQIPSAAGQGAVRDALHLSIPIFAAPMTRADAHVRFHVENDAGQAYLVVLNDGGRHETIRDIAMTTSEGAVLTTDEASPYVLAGAARRWRIAAPANLPAPGGTWRLTARADAGAVDEPVPVGARPRQRRLERLDAALDQPVPVGAFP